MICIDQMALRSRATKRTHPKASSPDLMWHISCSGQARGNKGTHSLKQKQTFAFNESQEHEPYCRAHPSFWLMAVSKKLAAPASTGHPWLKLGAVVKLFLPPRYFQAPQMNSCCLQARREFCRLLPGSLIGSMSTSRHQQINLYKLVGQIN